ncbi:MAG TPA: hypothetical protein PKD47_05910, partial [Solirubrobacterales bacterium]|nr:hypothetical protein [Solirubrobacterales bacterium]
WPTTSMSPTTPTVAHDLNVDTRHDIDVARHPHGGPRPERRGSTRSSSASTWATPSSAKPSNSVRKPKA